MASVAETSRTVRALEERAPNMRTPMRSDISREDQLAAPPQTTADRGYLAEGHKALGGAAQEATEIEDHPAELKENTMIL